MAAGVKHTFPSEIIDEKRRYELRDGIERFAEALPGYLATLEAEGLPTDIDAINQLADMDEAAYIAHVKKLFKDYLTRLGFCPKSERRRIADNFNGMLERTATAVAWLHNYKAGGFGFKVEDDKVIADTSEAYKTADAQTATPIDTEALAEYRELWGKVAEMFARLNAWERKHGLPETQADGHFNFVNYIADDYADVAEVSTAYMIGKQGNEGFNDIFLKVFGQHFAK